MPYQPSFPQEEIACEVARVKELISERGYNNHAAMGDLSNLLNKFGPNVKQYYNAVVNEIKNDSDQVPNQAFSSHCDCEDSAELQLTCRKCHPETNGDISAALQYVMEDKAGVVVLMP
ncbi:MAG: hypothetical protein COA42_06225 [Alteromonadaceae bacterium]|nr:MAG: hypothetical protein COA42_06225 [Alteromonadaceae bacterium]